MARKNDARALAQPLLKELYELHNKSRPQTNKFERGKGEALRDAYRAIQVWWQLYGILMPWAQYRILGHELVQASPEKMAALAGLGRDDFGDAIVEFLGFNVHPRNRPPPELASGLSDDVLRKVIVRLLASSDEVSSVWRDPLRHALRAANAGEVHPLFDPGKKRRRGRPYVLDTARAIAVAHVYYLVGKGFKKHVALERVSKELPASSETIRSWEKSLAADRWFIDMWSGARLAGKLEMEGRVVFTQDESESVDLGLEPDSMSDFAIRFLERLHGDWSLEAVKEDLARFHNS